MEAVSFSETVVKLYQVASGHIPGKEIIFLKNSKCTNKKQRSLKILTAEKVTLYS
jgi:hypothetical protein